MKLLFLLNLLLFAATASGEEPNRLEVFPREIDLTGKDRIHGVIVTAWTRSGPRDVTREAKLKSETPRVVTIDGEQNLRLAGDGTGRVSVAWGGLETQITVHGADRATEGAVSFRDDVLPVLTKTGCNAGGCHGKLAGQNGFRLSLRGFAPELDYEWITSEVRARRVNFAFPEESLLLRKPAGFSPHEGGRRFSEESRYYNVLADWIAQRSPAPLKDEAMPESLEILPGDRLMTPGQTQQLLVRAHYPHGRVRDVTWLAQFFSNDESLLSVTRDGEVKALRHGEGGVRAHFEGLARVIRFTMPFTNTVAPGFYARRVNKIDAAVFAKLAALKIPPSPDCDDATFMRRASLDATGTLPSPAEVKEFVASSDPAKRAKLVDRLLASSEFTDYWTLQLADLLQNRKERDHDVRGTKGVRSFHQWLRGEVAAGTSWDKLAAKVLSASGDSIQSPQVGYFLTTIGEFNEVEKSEVTDSVAQAFLGTRIGCAKCHNHPLERFTQDDYYHFAAFFAKVSLDRKAPEEGESELRVQSRAEREVQRRVGDIKRDLDRAKEKLAKAVDEKGRAEEEKRIAEKTRQLEEQEQELARKKSEAPAVEQPRTRQRLGPRALDGSVPEWAAEEDPRQAFVRWMVSTNNHEFSGAMVNRLWKHFLGAGLVEQVDDLRASNPPSNAELWALLNGEFVASGYDLRHLMRLILNSRTYQLSSETLAENESDAKFYSHYYARRLPAEVILDAISTATGVPDKFDGYPVGTRATQLPEPHVGNYFLGLFGRSERVTACACERKGEVTLPQLLNLRNGTELAEKLRSEEGRLKGLADSPPETALEEIFLCTVSREPSASELAALSAALSSSGQRAEVYEDLFWALFNSKEFVFNH